MSRHWKRAPILMRCGRCGETIARGDAYEEIQVHASRMALKHPKRRCRHCASSEEPPTVLTPSYQPAPLPPLSFGRFSDLQRDFKLAQSAREPGEDG